MVKFRYKAVDDDGALLEGELEATTESDALQQLKALGYAPIRATAERNGISELSSLIRRRKPRIPMARFARDMGTLLVAGIGLEQALQMQITLMPNSASRSVLQKMLDGVRNGNALSAVMADHSEVFSRFHINMVRAGEASGALGAVMLRLADSIEQLDALKESVKSALIYPSLLLLVTIGTLLILMIFVVPQFSVMFAEMGRELPLATRLISRGGELLHHYWWIGALCLLGFVRLLQYEWHNPKIRLAWERRIYRWPLIGELVQRMQSALFARTLATLIANGVPLLNALHIVRDTLTSLLLKSTLERVADGVKEGHSLANQMAMNEGFAPVAVHLVRVGEETGQLEAMLLQISEILERETRLLVQRMLALLEPLLIVGMGVVVGGIIMSILMAIFSINDLTL